MVQALRLLSEEPTNDEECAPLRRVVRIDLAAWSEQTAKLRFAFRLPGKMPPGPYGEKDTPLQAGVHQCG